MSNYKSQLPVNYKIVTGYPHEFANLITNNNDMLLCVNPAEAFEDYQNYETIIINDITYLLEEAIDGDSVSSDGRGHYLQKIYSDPIK
jgi:hypothetical protein